MVDQSKHYDVVIVGSGFAGATLAKKLGEAGKEVLILEAGPAVPRSREDYMENFFLTTFKSPESPYPPKHLARDPDKTNVPRPSIPDLVLGWGKKKANSSRTVDPISSASRTRTAISPPLQVRMNE
ncbi:NAD(P)-binding protein [Agrobacterium sp. LMR679]|uniref:NAD(P)-binding protein n=1 Tax=Agrobacterium sp. LMR679 TaxID=3014335 RepID=UPI0022B03BFB|nr:NAD(P)-binding protein [Agrobacterium sp. LMR679]MCZ4072083.1 NAD(P)-binding protein [Agrobacterium sp. LMR679]